MAGPATTDGGLYYRDLPLMEMWRHNAHHLRDTALVEILSYLVFAGAMFAVVLMLRRAGVFRFRIRRTLAKAAQMRREIFDSTLTLLIFQLAQVLFRVAALAWGISFDLTQRLPTWELALSFPLILVVHDAYFYWTHRAMHSRALFRFMHWEHHKSLEPTPWTAYSFAIPEAFVQGSFVVFYVALFPAMTATIVFFAFVEIIHNVAIHSGIDLFPRPLVTGRRLGWIAGSIYHDLHHRTSNANYGLYFRVWDRLMGTEHPDFVRIYDYVHSPQNDGGAYRLIGSVKVTE
ncbi:MAG: sterol desaturase family protein [Pseudomonadota bacterium]